MKCVWCWLPPISSTHHCFSLCQLYGSSLSYHNIPHQFATSTIVLGSHFSPIKFLSSITATQSEVEVNNNGRRQYPPPWFSVAPMMDWTDNHYRTLARLISQKAWLYTEMIVAETIVHQHANLDRFLEFPETHHPIVLQIGGSNLANLAKAAELANAYGYDEINLNCGCPSGKVAGHGCFGAQLMFNPKLVGEAMAAIAANSDVPVSVKCRIGVDDRDTYDELCTFIDTVSSMSPTRHFIIHARKALLNGLSPAENRTVPPLKYEYVFGLIRDFPHLHFTINGGIASMHQENHLEENERSEENNYINVHKWQKAVNGAGDTICDNISRRSAYGICNPCISTHVKSALEQGAYGAMIGRAAYNIPWSTLGHVDTAIYCMPSKGLSRRQIFKQYQMYADSVIGKYGPNKPSLRHLVKPLLNMFHSEPGAGLWRRRVDAALRHCTTVQSVLEETLEVIPDSVFDASPPVQTPSDEPFAKIQTLLPQLHGISSLREVVGNVQYTY